MTKQFAYELVCHDHKGWGACADGLWSLEYADRADRIFATSKEARAVCREMLNAGCWYTEDWETEERFEDIPDFQVHRISVYEACWMDPDADRAVIDRLVDIHGRDIRFRAMPRAVADFLIRQYGGVAADLARESASLAGVSSATHTAAFIGAGFGARVKEIRDMLADR